MKVLGLDILGVFFKSCALVVLITVSMSSYGKPKAATEEACECDGKLTTLLLRYTGQTMDIVIVQKNGDTIYSAETSSNHFFALTGTDQRGKKVSNTTFGPWIDLYQADGSHTRIHTSCSIEINVGDVFGDFEVLSGTSRNNGLICGAPPIND